MTGLRADLHRRLALGRGHWRGPITLAVLVVGAIVGSGRTGIPDPVPANAPDTLFSSGRAMVLLDEVSRAPHPAGSPEHTRVRESLIDRLEGLGLEPELQTGGSIVQEGGVVRTGTMRNIIARVPGTKPSGAILITAHYDGRDLSPAAADDGSGVAAILEALRASLSAGPLENDVIVLLTDGEEVGLLGARLFAAEHPSMEEVSIVVSLEMRGAGGPSVMFETNTRNGWIIRQLQAFDPAPNATSLAFEVYQRLPNSTDFTPLREAGLQGLNFAVIDRANVYHQVFDTPENLSEATLQHHGLHLLRALRHLGFQDLSAVDAPSVVYFTVPILGLIVYESFWIHVISLGLIILIGVGVVRSLGGGARLSGIVGGAVVAVAGPVVAAGVAILLLKILPRIHPEMGSLQGSALHSEGWYVLALAAATFGIIVGLSIVARRWLSASEVAIGALLLPTALAVSGGFLIPFGAMTLQWPVIAAALALLAIAHGGTPEGGRTEWITVTLCGMVAVVLLVPIVEMLWLALSIRLAVGLAVLLAMTVQLFMPALDSFRRPNDWWAPATGLVLAAAFMGAGVSTAATSTQRPMPSTLVYAYDHGSGAASWATRPSSHPTARAWVEARTSKEFTERRSLGEFGYFSRNVPVAEAPVTGAPPPEVVVRTDTVVGGVRRTQLGIRSLIGAEMVQFRYGSSGTTRLLSINGKPIEDPDGLRWADHWGVPEGAIVLDIETPVGQVMDLYVIEHLLRPGGLLSGEWWERPPTLVPNINWMSDRAMFRFHVETIADLRREGEALP